MPWIDKKYLLSDPRKTESGTVLPFPNSLSVGLEIMVGVQLRNIGIRPCYMGARWVISNPSGVMIQTFERWLTESQIKVNGRFIVEGPLLTLQQMGPYTIKLDALISNTGVNTPDAAISESYNGLLVTIVEADQSQGKIETTPPMPTASPVTSKPLAIPHPEEPMNSSATLANTDVTAIINKWLLDWGVPAQYWDYWKKAIDIQVYEIYPPSLTAAGLRQDIPAATWEANGKRHLATKPKWLNPGVIAHEQAHNSYALLNSSQKAAFAALYTPLKNSDPLIRLLYSKNTYGLTNDIEGHAEVYRYIGQQMPTQLKPYYPKLF